MSQHFVYFFGSTRIILGHKSLSSAAIRRRNQIVGFEGIDENPELFDYGERCFNKKNRDGSMGETGVIPSKNLSIIPFRYLQTESTIIQHLEDVLNANEKYIKSESIGFPLMMLRSATQQAYNYLGKGNDLTTTRKREQDFKSKWCCFGHYYLHLLKIALTNKGYQSYDGRPMENLGNLINTRFFKGDGTRLEIHADAGM